MFNHSILGNFCFETFFGELEAKTSTYADSNEQSELLQITQNDEPHCTTLEDCTKVDTNISLEIVPSSCNFALTHSLESWKPIYLPSQIQTSNMKSFTQLRLLIPTVS